MEFKIYFLNDKAVDVLDVTLSGSGRTGVNFSVEAPADATAVSDSPRIEVEEKSKTLSAGKRSAVRIKISGSQPLEPGASVCFRGSSGETLFELPVKTRIGPRKKEDSRLRKKGLLNPLIRLLPHGDFRCKNCGAAVPDKRPYCNACKREMVSALSEEETAADKGRGVQLYWVTAAVILLCAAAFWLGRMTMDGGSGVPGAGDLTITSDPSGARVVSLDNSFSPGTTPLTLRNLPAGLYKFSLHMQHCGGGDEIHGAEVKKEQTVSYHASLPRLGSLSVKTVPAGARILLDGLDLKQKTPYTAPSVGEGAHDVTLIFNETTKRTLKAHVAWKQEALVYATADGNMSALELGLPENMKIFIDGVYIGKTPLPPVQLKPGKHSFSIVSETAFPLKGDVELEKGVVTSFSPPMKYFGVLEIKSPEPAKLYVREQMMGRLPLKINCPPGEKVVAEVVSDDGRIWKQGFILKEGEKRTVTAKLPAAPVYSYSDWTPPPAPSYSSAPAAPPADFSGFSVTRRFPASQWKLLEQMYEDLDQDGESEMILAFRSLSEKGSDGYRIYAFVIKKHNKDFFDVIPLRNPRLGCLGEGELISLDVVKADRYGYREVYYSCGTAKKGVLEKGAFVIYKGKGYAPQWTKGQ